MKNHSFLLYKALICTTILFICSCKKFVEIPSPENQLVTKTVFESNETAISALTGIYSHMVNDRTFPYSLAMYTGIGSDELKSYSTSVFVSKIYSNSLTSVDGGLTDNFWNTGYNLIYLANAVYEGCNSSIVVTPEVKKQLMAEALFIRSWWYFYLVNLYGDVPLLTTTDYQTNSKAARTPKDQIYAQIISDLTNAEQNITQDYLDGTNHSTTAERVRPNKAAVTALLAKVALYAGNYTLAEQEASKVIANTSTYKLTDLNAVFLLNSQEAIWQLMMPFPNATNANSQEGQFFILTSKPATGEQNHTTVSPSLYNSFEIGDQRKKEWIGRYTDALVNPNVDYYFPYKFKQKNNNIPTEYTTPLRLGEQFLIRAEARAQLANISGSKDDLNSIRYRAGLGDTPADDKITLLTAIIKERRHELFAEWGNRWFDLKRSETIDDVMTVEALFKGSTWMSYQQLWPIPNREIQNDQNLKQNPGYN